MSRLFLCTSFSGHVNHDTGEVQPVYRKSIEAIITALRDLGGFTVFCAVEDEGWMISEQAPEIGVKQDLDEIAQSEVVLALLPAGVVSSGLQFEIGYASGLGKPVFVATAPDTTLSYFNQGLTNLGRLTHIRYEDAASLVKHVKKASQL